MGIWSRGPHGCILFVGGLSLFGDFNGKNLSTWVPYESQSKLGTSRVATDRVRRSAVSIRLKPICTFVSVHTAWATRKTTVRSILRLLVNWLIHISFQSHGAEISGFSIWSIVWRPLGFLGLICPGPLAWDLRSVKSLQKRRSQTAQSEMDRSNTHVFCVFWKT